MASNSKITEEVYRAAVCSLLDQPLWRLKKRHAIIQAQERLAENRHDKDAIRRLDVLERIAADAVFLKEFHLGAGLCVRKPRRSR